MRIRRALLSMAPLFPIAPNESGLYGNVLGGQRGDVARRRENSPPLTMRLRVKSRGATTRLRVGAQWRHAKHRKVSPEVVLAIDDWSSAGNLSRGAGHEN